MGAYNDQLRYELQPLYSLHTGCAVAVESLARPVGIGIRDLFAQARRNGRLCEVDIDLAARAIDDEAQQQTLLPLHVNLLAPSVAAPAELMRPLLDAVAVSGRRPKDVIVEIGPPFTQVSHEKLVEGLHRLREYGFPIAIDGLGIGDLPLSLLADVLADMVKIDRSLLRALPSNPAAQAIVEAVVHVAARTDARIAACGVETDQELRAARAIGVRIVQGPALSAEQLPLRDLMADTGTVAGAPEIPTLSRVSTPSVADFVRSPVALAATATCDDARRALAADDKPMALVGLDTAGRPQWTIDRSRFLLQLSGRYGHALHATKPATRFADAPHIVRADATALDALELVADAEADRIYDDLVVVDRDGVCLGVVRVAELIRGVADSKIRQAATLHPLTGLPTSDTVARDVTRRIAAGEPFVAAWLDIDDFGEVNERLGFAAGDTLIRSMGDTLSELARILPKTTICHVDGDDFLLAADPDEIGTLAPALLDTPWRAQDVQVSVSLAGLVCGAGTVATYEEVSAALAGLRRRAKQISGSAWVLGRPGVERVDVLRSRFAVAQAQGVA